MQDGITFQAIFQKFTTLIDGGYRVTFDVSQNDAQKLFQLSQVRESLLQIAVIPIGPIENGSIKQI
jgi:hypothetical protein